MTKDDFIGLKLKAFDQIAWILGSNKVIEIKHHQITGIIGFIETVELDLLREGVLDSTPDKIPEGTDSPCDICKFSSKDSDEWPCTSCIRGGGDTDYFKL